MRLFIVLTTLSFTASLAPAAARPPSFGQNASAADGVFSAAQVQRGRETYHEKCSFCHPLTPRGPNAMVNGWEGDPLVGDAFLKRYATVFQLFDVVRKMPDNDPGGLGRQRYLDLTAFILEANRLPAGNRELAGDDETLKRIGIASSAR